MSDIELKPVGLVDRAALDFLKTKKLLPGFSYLDVWLHEHSVAFTVAKMMDADMLAETRAAIADALQNGTAFADFKQRLKPYLMSRGWWGEQIRVDPLDGVQKIVQLGSTRRLQTIFQTNMATAQAAGQWARVQVNKKAMPYLRYNRSAAGQPRDSHKRYYGLVLPVDDPIWSQIYPPNGYGCLCSVSQLTRGQAERAGISTAPDVPMVEVTNQRTGQVVTIPADITPSFAHNHGDRLGALEALFGERHDADALDKMVAAREAWLEKRYQAPSDLIKTTVLPDKYNATEVPRLTRLVGDAVSKNTTQVHEAEAAARWQVLTGKRLVVDDRPTSSLDFKPVDYLVEDLIKPKSEWQRVDFMFTDKGDAYTFINKNKHFASNKHRLDALKIQIDNHLDKADIVPMDFSRLNAANRAIVLDYVLSLSDEKIKKIQILVKESK